MTVNFPKAPVHPMYFTIDMEKTGEQLKNITREKGYDVKDLMTLTGISSSQAIYKWFNGKSIPSIEALVTLSIALDKEISELLVIDGDFDFFGEVCNCWLNDKGIKREYDSITKEVHIYIHINKRGIRFREKEVPTWHS